MPRRKEKEEKEIEGLKRALFSRTQEIFFFYEVSRILASTLDLKRMLDMIVELLLNKFNFDSVSVRLLGEDGILRIVSQKGLSKEYVEKGARELSMDSYSGECFLTNRMVVKESVDNLDKPLSRELVCVDNIKSFAHFPLSYGGDIVGVLTVRRKKEGFFTNDMLQLISSFCSILTLAIRTSLYYEKLASFSKELEKEVEKRTKELSELNKRLRKFDEMKSKFLEKLSYRFKIPLASVIGYSELLLDGEDGFLTASQTDSISRIYKNGKMLLELVNELLELSEIDVGKFELNKEPMDAYEVLKSAIFEVEPIIVSKRLKLHKELDEGVPYLFADREKIEEVLLKIFHTLAFSIDKGRLTVRLSRQNGFGLFSIMATGLFLDEREKEKIFDLFSYGEVKKMKGGEMGLILAKNIVEMHGGKMWICDDIEGSLFCFTLPEYKGGKSE